jgi:phosphoribosylformylglycinamidine synthase
MERAFAERALATSRRSCVRGGRVVAGGGLAAALAKCVIFAGIGMEVDMEAFGGEDSTATLFGEGGPRAVYAVQPDGEDKFISIWEGYPAFRIGSFGGDSLKIRGIIDVPAGELARAFRDSAPLLTR